MSEQLKTIKPLGDRVLIKRVEEKERPFGSIIIPKTANEIDTAWIADVIAVGVGRVLENGKLLETTVKVGEKVLIGKYSGTEVRIEGNRYYVVREDDIFGVVEES